jgi:hypothetical protein
MLIISCSCMTSRQLIKLKEKDPFGTISIENLDHISETDQIVAINGSFNPLLGSRVPGLGINASYQKINTGEFKISLDRYFLLNQIAYSDEYSAKNSSVYKCRLITSFEYPFKFSHKTLERAVPLYKKIIDNNYYYTIMDVKFERQWNLRIGAGHIVSAKNTYSYANLLNSQGKTISFDDSFNEGALEIRQGSYFGSIGISFSNLSLTSFNAKDESNDFIGIYNRKSSFYGELRYLLFSQIDPIKYHYRYYKDNQGFIDEYATVNPSQILTKKYLGFALGYNWKYLGSPVENSSFEIFEEFGTIPGYFEKFTNSLNINTGVRIGYGKVLKR